MGVVDQGAARHTNHPVLVGYQVRCAWCVVPQATCQSPAQASNLAAQEDLLEVARGAVSLSVCTPFQPVAEPKTVAYSVLCPLALVEEARQFLQVPFNVSERLAGACTCNAEGADWNGAGGQPCVQRSQARQTCRCSRLCRASLHIRCSRRCRRR